MIRGLVGRLEEKIGLVKFWIHAGHSSTAERGLNSGERLTSRLYMVDRLHKATIFLVKSPYLIPATRPSYPPSPTISWRFKTTQPQTFYSNTPAEFVIGFSAPIGAWLLAYVIQGNGNNAKAGLQVRFQMQLHTLGQPVETGTGNQARV